MSSLPQHVLTERLDVSHRSGAGYKEGAHRYLLFSKRVQKLDRTPHAPDSPVNFVPATYNQIRSAHRAYRAHAPRFSACVRPRFVRL